MLELVSTAFDDLSSMFDWLAQQCESQKEVGLLLERKIAERRFEKIQNIILEVGLTRVRVPAGVEKVE